MATFVSDGRYVDYTPSTAVAAGAVVVQGDLVAVAIRSIPANVKGALCVAGVVSFPKATGAITAGTSLYWDATNGVATSTATSNKLIGKSVAAAASADATVEVLLRQ